MMKFVLDHFVQDALILTLAVVFFVWILRKHLSAYLGEKGKLKAQIEDIQKVTRLTETASQEFIERNAFLAEKGKQAATKEDIEHVTRVIESVRTEHMSTLELLKVELSKKGTIHRLRMEKEFEVLSKAWDTLAELRFATERLFPSGLQPLLEGEDQRHDIKERHQAFNEAYDNYLNATYKNKPFFTRELYKSLDDTMRQAKLVEVNFRYGINAESGRLSSQAYEQTRPVLTSFLELVENASQQIDERPNA